MKTDRNRRKNPLPVSVSIFYHRDRDRNSWERVRNRNILVIWKRTSTDGNATETGGNGTLKPESRLFIEYITFYNQFAATPTQI